MAQIDMMPIRCADRTDILPDCSFRPRCLSIMNLELRTCREFAHVLNKRADKND
ncbi:MAG: Hypothetical protein BHV28_08330 [Candidatus Tokpelaia hoelldobleri]|uniref:Uncharacterized protein n=1 Tax=Candidatus Tokpelaia hoelldobleri TaxID=1902579 RepID=A0A1U9JUI1_9HYPH|nr:MAG: Hypothetical protein BHV28_08330 [Candidatus Tokpelaia hoelldoblerii]